MTFTAFATTSDNQIGADAGISVFEQASPYGMDPANEVACEVVTDGSLDGEGDFDDQAATALLARMGWQLAGAGWRESGGQWAIEVERIEAPGPAITAADLAAAGIDPAAVSTDPAGTTWVTASGARLAYGDSTTETGAPAPGWDYTIYVTPEGGGEDEVTAQDWQRDAGGMLAVLADFARTYA
jgi:hypothetical protein